MNVQVRIEAGTGQTQVNDELQATEAFDLVESPRRGAVLCADCSAAERIEDVCANCCIRVYGGE